MPLSSSKPSLAFQVPPEHVFPSVFSLAGGPTVLTPEVLPVTILANLPPKLAAIIRDIENIAR
jgi:hypothetical protein